MAEWRVSLLGQDRELELLMQSMADEPDWSIAKGAGSYYLVPKRVFNEDQIGDVQTAAEIWVKRINLAGPLLQPDFQEISFTVEYVKDDGTELLFTSTVFAGTSNLAAIAAVTDPSGTPVEAQILPIVSVAQAIACANVAEAVQLFHARRDDWTQLCNVIQMVRDGLKSDIPRDWVSCRKLKLLEQTAQFRETAGDTARHTKAKGKPPRKPMPLAEAQEIVRQILIRWLQNP
jgi:hypothetical protein